jgi:competence ComEA-like helix-hairpin-helix protein
MPWLYRLQQRLAITRAEALALLVFALLIVFGSAARYVQHRQVPPLTVPPAVPLAAAGADTAGVTAPGTTAPGPVNVNTASVEQLQRLPGIGPALSRRIEQYRTGQRPFQSVEELRRVPGIGAKTLAALRPLVTVSTPPSRPPEDAGPNADGEASPRSSPPGASSPQTSF